MKDPKNPKLLEYILTELNKKGVDVQQGNGKSSMTTAVGDRSKKLHLKYPMKKN
jgi:hypothetical protein